jgi:hypothetical protein
VSTRSFILAMAAFATVGSAALTPTGASANMPTGVIVKKPVMGVPINPPKPVFGVKPKPILGVVINPPHPITGVVINPPHPITGVVINPDPDHDHDGHFWWHHHHVPDFVVGGDAVRVSSPVLSAPAPVTTAVPSAPCNCLTKQYLQDGSVLFKDICTKEAAVATPDELKAQLQGSGPQVH